MLQQEILVNVSFLKRTLTKKDAGVVEGDYNSTKLVFVFEEDIPDNCRVVFEMSNPNGEVILLKELEDREVVLVGYDDEGKAYSLFTEAGLYPFELVLYGDNSKLTSAPGWLGVNKSHVDEGQVGGLEPYLPLFDELLLKFSNLSIVLYSEQELTPDEKAQARYNIGVPDECVDKTARDEIAKLNEAVFDMEVVEPSINLWNPDTAYTRVSQNDTDKGKEMLLCEAIPCKVGDVINVRIKDENGKVSHPNITVYCYRFVASDKTKNDPRCNKTYTWTVPETVEGLVDIVGVEVGIQTSWLTANGKTASDLMVTLNEVPEKGSEWVEYRKGGEVKHDRIQLLRDEVDSLKEQTEGIAAEVEVLKESLVETDPELAAKVEALSAAVFETVDLNPCINLFNPNKAEVETLTNCANGAYNGIQVLVSDFIPCVPGDWFYPRVRDENGKVTAIFDNVHYYRLVDANGVKSRANPSITYQYKIPETFTGATGAIVGVEVGVRVVKPDAYTGQWYETASDIMVTKNEAPAKGSEFVDWHESEIVTRDRITPLQEQVDTLCASVDEQMGEMRDQVAKVASGAGTIPEYWEEHLAEKIARVRELQRAGGKDCYSFVALADYHGAGNNSQSPALIKRIADACNIKFCLCLGDIQSGAAVGTKATFVKDWEIVHDDFTPIRDMTLFTAGNHDGAYGTFDKDGSGSTSGDPNENYVYSFTRDEIYDFVFRSVSKINGVVFNDTCDAYYVDDTTAKVRYLLMNSNWTVDGVDENGCSIHPIMRGSLFGQSQQDFAIEALKSLPDDGWNVVVGCHEPITQFPGDGGGRDLSLFRDVLVAFQNRTTISRTYGTVGDFNYVSVNADFTDAKGSVAGAFVGHMHKDLMNTDYPFPIVVHANDNTGASFAGTTDEQSFDIVTVNKREGTVYLTKVGKGEDRVATRGE